MGGVSRKITVHALGTKTENAEFVETGITGQTYLIVVRYSAANNEWSYQAATHSLYKVT
jgi:hypothetical protein